MKNGLHTGTAVVVMLLTITMLAGCAQASVVVDPANMAGMTGMIDARGLNIPEDWRSDLINPDTGVNMDITHPERYDMEATSSDSPFTHGIAAGDLNGDGADDALIFNGTYESSTDFSSGKYVYDYISAVNGRDGTELWRYDLESTTGEVTVGDVPAHPIGDLNGDGTDDILVIVNRPSSDTGETTATVSAIRGENGAELWSQTITGDTGFGYGFGYGTHISSPEPCDLDGDGENDVLLMISIQDSDAGKTTTTVHAKHGDTGDDFWSQSLTGTGIWMWAHSGCDLDGDDKDDVIVDLRSLDITTGETTATVHAKHGDTGDDFWSQSETGEYVSVLAYTAGDLDGDDKDDVLTMFQTCDFETDNFSATVYLKHGETGADLWSQSAAGKNVYMPLLPLPGCDLNGDGEGDVIITSHTTTADSGDETTTTVHAKRGRDGHEFWSQSTTGKNISMFAHTYCDFDGDGEDDVIVSLIHHNTTSETNATVHVKHGKDGVDFWSQSITGKAASMGMYPHCDLNGDGKSDVIAISEVTDPATNETTITLHAKRGDTGIDFWNQEATGVNITLSAYSHCDFNSDGKDDVIVESEDRDSGDAKDTATISVKNGETGTELWSQTVTGKGVWIDDDRYNYYLRDHDSDCDGSEDLLITTGVSIDTYIYGMYFGSTKIPTRVCAVKGSSGTPLWCEPSSGSSTPPAQQPSGDLNGDDAITPADAVVALEIVISGNYNDAADVNDDGVVNSLDVLMIMQAVIGAITL